MVSTTGKCQTCIPKAPARRKQDSAGIKQQALAWSWCFYIDVFNDAPHSKLQAASNYAKKNGTMTFSPLSHLYPVGFQLTFLCFFQCCVWADGPGGLLPQLPAAKHVARTWIEQASCAILAASQDPLAASWDISTSVHTEPVPSVAYWLDLGHTLPTKRQRTGESKGPSFFWRLASPDIGHTMARPSSPAVSTRDSSGKTWKKRVRSKNCPRQTPNPNSNGLSWPQLQRF